MNIKNIDLNLLVALDALLTHGSVTQAAMAINLSQPAMSRALDRLRQTLKDPLLVRSGRGMVLTPRAESLRLPLQDALERVKLVMAPNEFVPEKSQAQFRIIGVDYVTHLILPLVLERIYAQAPNVKVSVEHISEDTMAQLRDGQIDLGIGVVKDGPVAPTIYSQALFDDGFVCVMRRGHALSGGPLDLDRFISASHALLSLTGRGGGEIDRRLAKLGLKRHIALRLSHFLSIHSILARTDLIATIPRGLATQVLDPDLVSCDLPQEIRGDDFTVSQIWHERFHQDPARKWLRAMVRSVIADCIS